DPSATLELLGLTPAEARLASEVGNGLSPKQAATRLGITTNTARSTLQVIYEKLGIGKQSELARIVTRLEVFGRPPPATR
uniref:helix-turn-helix transcriptional regulator n=1 Tax=Devosia sp. TaxID=1871048 RepID=UPI0035AD8611